MLTQEDLAELDRTVDRMLLTGNCAVVEVVGEGAIACVLAWRGYACKRLPPFDSQYRLDAYRAVLDVYLERLRAAGVPFVETQLEGCARPHGCFTGYVVQPRLDADSLLPARMMRATPQEALDLFREVLDHVDRFVTPETGLDAQLSNWAVDRGRLVLLDVTTPLLRDKAGRDVLDAELFIAVLPVVVQSIVRRFYVQDLFDRAFDVRTAILDVLGNAPNCGLGHLREPFLDEANRRLKVPLTMREVRAYHFSEETIWAILRFCLAIEQFWQRKVKHSPHPVLLPSEFRQKP